MTLIVITTLLMLFLSIILGDRRIDGVGRKSDYESVEPNDYLGWSILAALCCFWPTGIVAIIFSAKVKSEWRLGHKSYAYELSKKAKKFCWISLVAAIYMWELVWVSIYEGWWEL